MALTILKEVVMRILSGITACLFFASVPIMFIAAETWRKIGIIPIIGFGLLFGIYAVRGNKQGKMGSRLD